MKLNRKCLLCIFSNLILTISICQAQSEIYGELKRELDETYFPTISKKLNFVFEEKYTIGSLNYSIYNSQRIIILSSNPGGNNLLVKPKVMGKNFIQFDFTLNSYGLIHNDYYILEVIDEKGQKLYMRFKYLNS